MQPRGPDRCHTLPLLGSVLALALALPAQTVTLSQTPPAIQVDGVLQTNEWALAAPLLLDRQDQVWSAETRASWNGPADLSGTFRIIQDGVVLYLAGHVQDDSVLVPGPLESRRLDRLQILLEVREGRRGPERACLLDLEPLRSGRTWSVAEDAGEPGKPAWQPGGSEWTGVQVRGRAVAGGYEFECALPLHNFLVLGESGTASFGFNLGLLDVDAGDAATVGMSWTGADPARDLAQVARVDVLAPTRSERAPGAGSFFQRLWANAPYVLLPLAAFVCIGSLLWLWARVLRRFPRWQPISRMAGVVLLGLGLLLPPFLLWSRDRAAAQRMETLVGMLAAEVPRMEQGSLASLRGGHLDAPLLDLLSGKPVSPRQGYAYVTLADVAAGGFGDGPKRYPNGGFAVLPYWVPLANRTTERFAFAEPLVGRSLYVVLSKPALPPGFRRVDDTTRVRLWSREPGAVRDGEPIDLVLDRPLESGSVFNREDRDMLWFDVPLKARVESVAIEAEGEGLQLVGLTLARERGDVGQPLALGQASLGGVETDLRGAYPEEAGVELFSGQSHAVRLAGEKPIAANRCWVFHRARAGAISATSLPAGTRVGEVRLHLRDPQGKPAQVKLALEHQVSVFFDRARANLYDRPPEGSGAEIAFRWQDERGDAYVDLAQAIDVPEGHAVEGVEFANLGPYPLRFRALVFGSERRVPPQEQPDSPLQPTGQSQQVVLKRAYLDQVQGAWFAIYRGGKLVRTTLPEEQAQERRLQRQQPRPPAEQAPIETVTDELGGRVYEAFVPLPGPTWSGAVLGVFLPDLERGPFLRWLDLLQIAFCVLAAPALLFLLSEGIAALGSLRLRLMAVLTLAALVPLVLLSVVLVRVLEQEQERSSLEAVRAAMQSVSSRLQEQKARLQINARTWLAGLVQELQRVAGAAPVSAPVFERARPTFESLLRSQMPPEWKGAFSSLQWMPRAASGTQAPAPIAIGDAAGLAQDLALRSEPGLHLSAGALLLGVRAEIEVAEAGRCALSVGRALDESLLLALAQGTAVVLCDPHGYPLASIAGAAGSLEATLGVAERPQLLRDRAQAGREAQEHGQPVVREHDLGERPWLAAYELLRDQQDVPRALLGVLEPKVPPTLRTPFGLVPVRAFFAAAASCLVLLVVFLSLFVTTRITRPVEELERGAQAIRRGELDVRIAADERGQFGRVTRTFNAMAQQLQARIQDLHHLNRGIQELSSGLDLEQVLARALAFCMRHGTADRVRLLLREPDRVVPSDDPATALAADAPDVTALLRLEGPACFRIEVLGVRRGELGRVFTGYRSLLALPLLAGGRCRGAIALLFEREQPAETNLELLSAIAAQTATAIESASLKRLAAIDPVTGAFGQAHLRERAVQEVGRAQGSGRSLALGAIAVRGDLATLSAKAGSERFERWMERCAVALRALLPGTALLGRGPVAGFEFLLPDHDPEQAQRCLRHVLEAASWTEVLGGDGSPGTRFVGAVVCYPTEAASAEFLFAELEARLHESRRARATAEATPAASDRAPELSREGIVMTSPTMQQVLRTLEKVAPTDLNLLLEGETGTGKEVLANLIHRWSRRATGPLVKVHCAAIPANLLASELFGHEKGAFTGATARKAGRFEQAEGGTIFLDEIGEISAEVQITLLRVLQERVVDRVGGTAPVPVDVRVVAATNRNLRELVDRGQFREDLYYRLQGMVMTVPPLRERKQEIPALVEAFRAEAVAAGQAKVRGFTTEAIDELFRRPWPGNIRELRNVVTRAAVLASGEMVERRDLDAAGPGAALAMVEDADLPPAEAALPRPPVVIPSLEPMPPDPAGDPRIATPAEPVPAGGATEPAGDLQLAHRHQVLLGLFRERRLLSAQDYVASHAVSPRTALRDLCELMTLGLVERQGKRRGTRYVLSASGEIWVAAAVARGEIAAGPQSPMANS